MTTKTLAERFDQFDDEYIKFNRVEQKLSGRPDLHAFILLDKLQPGAGDLIGASEHDEFFLNINCDELAAVITDDQILELVRCGIRHDDDNDCLCMFA